MLGTGAFETRGPVQAIQLVTVPTMFGAAPMLLDPVDGHVMTITTEHRWNSIEQRSDSAFALAGAALLASLVVPVGLAAVTDRPWIAGIALAGVAVLSVTIGLFGLYARVNDLAPRLSLAGVGGASIAGVGALGLLGLAGAALVDVAVPGLDVPEPMGLFAALSLAAAGGIAVGLLAFGVAVWYDDTLSRTVGALLVVGGAALFVPVVVELFGPTVGVETPAWLLFAVIALVAVDALAIGDGLATHARVG